MANDQVVFFKSILPLRAKIAILGVKTDDKYFKQRANALETHTDDTVGLQVDLTDNLSSYTDYLRVFVGNIKPTKMVELVQTHQFKVDKPDKGVYVGDVHGDHRLIIDVNSERLEMAVYVDNVRDVTMLYVFFDTKLSLKSQSQDYEDSLQAKIQELGGLHGCHVCGRKDREFTPHLLPSEELYGHTDRAEFFPICTEDYEDYKKELHNEIIGML